MSRTRVLALGLAACLGAGALGSCTSSAQTAATTTTLSAPDLRARLAGVVSVLRQIEVLGNRAASDSQVGAFDDAHDRTVKIDELWQSVEATVQAASPGSAAAIVRAVGVIRDGATHHDVANIEQGATDLAAAVDTFVAAHR